MAPRRSARISTALQKSTDKSTEQDRVTSKALSSRSRENRVAKPTASKKATTSTVNKTSRAGKKSAEDRPSKTTQAPIPIAPSTPNKSTRRSNQHETPAFPSTPPPPLPDFKRGAAISAPPDLNRPVDPHRTNATLVTPHGTHLTAYPRTLEEASPSKTGLPRPTATTGNILEHGLSHLLRVGPRLSAVIEKYPSPPFSASDLAEEVDPFQALSSGIIGQQVSGAAAKSIKKKFVALFKKGSAAGDSIGSTGESEKNDYDYGTNTQKSINETGDVNDGDNVSMGFPTPEEVVKCDLATLRTAGLSQRKAEYIHGLAEKFVSGELSARMLLTASDDEVLEKLIAVRGLGKWSVEMFSVFGLKRLDVFSTGDLGVQRGMAAYVGRDIAKLKAKGGELGTDFPEDARRGVNLQLAASACITAHQMLRRH
ncbi:conserved hypothetical protein [Uncinocarpus reesii 1704]|uniref:HhH-GPD domain-containing protein n=1 Tax=Uncinocarpus reesii (strain UAMH 1704) TaxID=336963 RepID=C4JSW2_UNCRE|nr:uncharacterized protein UREG_05551 [Uncinocarpus reesii 1704]EEP80709.1 conserved hypothetical protein [Uncinocarpus reesii 1704]